MEVFDEATLNKRRRRAAAAFGENSPLIVVGAGEAISIPGGLDQTFPYRPHPDYYWLTGLLRSGGVMAFDADSGWTHFVRPVSAAERLWEADVPSPQGVDIAQLDAWLAERAGRPIAALGSPIANVTADADATRETQQRFDSARRVKDAAELDLLARAVSATEAGFLAARQAIAPGRTEREIQIELEAEMFRHGAETTGYATIVGAGARAAVLHSQPGATVVQPDDVVLVDAGGAIQGYTADVTRTFAAGERFTPEQQALYDVVLAAQVAAIHRCRHEMEWHEVHRTAAAELADGLRRLGILKTSIDEALDSESIALFLPHGIGHMVGLGVRDVGGTAPGREPGRKCCGAVVRVDLPIQRGYLMTVEPGIYFPPAILDDPQRRAQFGRAVDWDELARWRPIGGIRIEDNVLVTDAAPKVITDEIPK
ncbi:MAG: aminopeptidase P N-terminal domain-containing protein [Pirellulaceae bacterium]